ncbi:MAG: ABC transporter ATP-binding protein [Akkermansiaceae bacterium]|nr:ABC transporter ATP-binding protein [Akkermansiaceae bacterium]
MQRPESHGRDAGIRPAAPVPCGIDSIGNSRAGWQLARVPDSSPILRADRLVKRFGSFTALDGLSFEVAPGESLGLLGVNGAGKTTAMNLLLGLTTPTSGTVEVFGMEFWKHRTEILRRINFSSAYTNLPSNLLVWQNLLVFARLYRVPHPKQRIDELLELLDITHLRKSVTGRLSAGESTRVNLAKALLNQPRLLLLDEPTASLDPDIADRVRKLLRKLQAETGISILYTSHNMRDIEEVCDRLIFLHHGKVLAEGTPKEVHARFHRESLEDLFIGIARGEIEEIGIG